MLKLSIFILIFNSVGVGIVFGFCLIGIVVLVFKFSFSVLSGIDWRENNIRERNKE